MKDTPVSPPPKSVLLWLLSCAFMVFVMIVIGAVTRLTESGLSITEWKPLIGVFPPLNTAEWERVFHLYQQTPEFQKKNFWMELGDFKKIFFWEWFHRFWGRLIGLVFAVPLIIFGVKGALPRARLWQCLGLLVLGGAQGFMGWYMVQSGLIDNPAVSQYRLAAHLALALGILGCILWLALSLFPPRKYASGRLYGHVCAAFALVLITIIWGAFTAGLDAGLLYNDSFPMMGGQWVPPDFWRFENFWHNITANHSAVQFTHRWLALLTVIMVLSLWVHGVVRDRAFPALHAVMGMVILQTTLGILTLFSGVALHVAVTHQACAVILSALLLLCVFQTKPLAQK